ncbi:hypothetical protein [Stenomitos frigidus]|uniref:Uncharacterized protein n=2 Tax=Stenomitos TaxID=1844270 RepID=A0A2T1EAZ3_9CYAN|nr:hypothetical protein C7B82_10210 [Stenomitos frigidus ULC18]
MHFNPLQGKPGEFRVALNLSELEERAWSLLERSQALGFKSPRFETYTRRSGVVEIWAVLLQEFHDYYAATNPVVDQWDDALAELRQAIGAGHEFNLIVLCNFAEYLEPQPLAV